MEDDLSDYERVRLENIRRNAEFLRSLGLSSGSTGSNKLSRSALSEDTGAEPEEESVISKVAKRKKEQKGIEIRQRAAEGPTRRSKRVKQELPEYGLIENPEELFIPQSTTERGDVKYGGFYPEESKELDDFEFEIFVKLRKWRLDKSRAQDVEPYKIFQNRTMCEAIRRRRNDDNWAKLTPVATAGENSNEVTIGEDVFDCWGIGPAKGKPGGRAEEMLRVLETDEVKELLTQSRALTNNVNIAEEKS
jgi:superfamily II DNA helicase RecQ